MSLADLPITNRDRAADDMALLRQYVDEDSQDAFAGLVDRHASWIHASARRALRARDLADDATQTVFVILARKAPSIAPNVRVSGWLYHTTRFVISDLRKRATRHRRRHDAIMRAALERKNNDTVRNTRRLDHVRDTIAEALARLPEHERNAIAMHFFEGMTFRQMGEVLGLSREGAKKRVARAMARLRAGFAVKGAAIAALATIGAAVRGLFAPAAVKAAITTIGHPTISLTKAGKLVGSGLKLLVNEITQNAARITALRVAGGAAVVGTAVICGTQYQSAHQHDQPGRRVGMQLPATSDSTSRGSSFNGSSSIGAIATADKFRAAETPVTSLRQLATIAAPTASVRGTQAAPRTVNTGGAVAYATFEDPFKRPPVYARSAGTQSAKASTRVDDFRAAGGGGSGSTEETTAGRKPLELPEKPLDPKPIEQPIPAPIADAGTPATGAPAANANPAPAGEVNRRVRRSPGEGGIASSAMPGTIFKNLSVNTGHASGGGIKLVTSGEVTGRPTFAPPAQDSGGQSRPTLGLPPKQSPTDDQTPGAGQPEPAPSDEKPAGGDEHGEPTPDKAGDDLNPAPPAPAPAPEPAPTAGEAPIPPSQPIRYHHDGGGQQSGGDLPVGAPSGGTSSGDMPLPAGDDGSFQPSPPSAPLPGGDNYDLLGHDATSPTPIADEFAPTSDDMSSSFDLPQLGDAQPAPTIEIQPQMAGGMPMPQPTLRALPEPSAGLVAIIAGVMGFARRRRRNRLA